MTEMEASLLGSLIAAVIFAVIFGAWYAWDNGPFEHRLLKSIVRRLLKALGYEEPPPPPLPPARVAPSRDLDMINDTRLSLVIGAIAVAAELTSDEANTFWRNLRPMSTQPRTAAQAAAQVRGALNGVLASRKAQEKQ